VHLKRYMTKMGYKYMILEPGTNTCLVNLGCISLRAAQSELRKWSTEEKRQAAMTKYHLQDETLLFTGYLKEYVTRYLPAKADKTITSELEAITKFKTFFAEIVLVRLSKADIQRYINWRLESPHARRGTRLSPATINLELRYLKHILNCAVHDELIEASPFKRSLRSLSMDKPPLTALSPTEFERLYQVASLYLKGILLCGAKLGLRPSEIMRIQFSDIDFSRKVLHVVSQGQRRTKTRKSRIVLLTDDLIEYLTLSKDSWPILNGTRYVPRTRAQAVHVFCKEDGTPFWSFKRAFNRAKTLAQIPHLTPRDLRKTFASWMAEMDVHPEKVRCLTGHSDIRVLLDHYTLLEVERMRDAVNRLPTMVLVKPDPDVGRAKAQAVTGQISEQTVY
jgi:integrase